MQNLSDPRVFLGDNFIFFRYLLILEENLAFAYISKLLCLDFSLEKAVFEDNINHSHVRVEDSLEKDSSFDALDRHLPCNFLDGNVVGDLDQ